MRNDILLVPGVAGDGGHAPRRSGIESPTGTDFRSLGGAVLERALPLARHPCLSVGALRSAKGAQRFPAFQANGVAQGFSGNAPIGWHRNGELVSASGAVFLLCHDDFSSWIGCCKKERIKTSASRPPFSRGTCGRNYTPKPCKIPIPPKNIFRQIAKFPPGSAIISPLFHLLGTRLSGGPLNTTPDNGEE